MTTRIALPARVPIGRVNVGGQTLMVYATEDWTRALRVIVNSVNDVEAGIAAVEVSFPPSGGFDPATVNVKLALEELDAEKATVSAVALKAPLASPTFTGVPLAPTAAASTNTTQIATTAFVMNEVASAVAGLLDLKGDTDASGNPNYPAASKGDAYYITVAGKIGGASGKSVDVGDVYIAKADNAGGNEAAVGTSWFVLEKNLSLSNVAITGGSIAMASGSIGYATGNGGAVTQLVSKTTGATLDELSGEVTMNNAALAAGATATFTLTNSTSAATDVIVINQVSGTANAYKVQGICAAGSVSISVTNETAGSLSEAVVLRFAIFKAATS